MPRTLLFCALILGLAVPVAAQELAGYTPRQPGNPPDRPEDLFQGDLISEMGLGCSNSPGTSGGPNDAAQGVTASIPPPFNITAHFYEIFTVISPTITALSFVCWEDQGAGPGMEFARQAGMDWSLGSHTVSIAPPIPIGAMAFYFGQNQPQTNVGIRWGLDTSGSSAERSYIRAPACGVDVFTLVDALGFPGNWVMSVTVESTMPVELQDWNPEPLLGSAWPNPFSVSTRFRYTVPGATRRSVALQIHDSGGRLVRVLNTAEGLHGTHIASWDGLMDSGQFAGTGVYFVHLRVGEQTAMKQVQLLR